MVSKITIFHDFSVLILQHSVLRGHICVVLVADHKN